MVNLTLIGKESTSPMILIPYMWENNWPSALTLIWNFSQDNLSNWLSIDFHCKVLDPQYNRGYQSY